MTAVTSAQIARADFMSPLLKASVNWCRTPTTSDLSDAAAVPAANTAKTSAPSILCIAIAPICLLCLNGTLTTGHYTTGRVQLVCTTDTPGVCHAGRVP